jgi:hypothetical protein
MVLAMVLLSSRRDAVIFWELSSCSPTASQPSSNPSAHFTTNIWVRDNRLLSLSLWPSHHSPAGSVELDSSSSRVEKQLLARLLQACTLPLHQPVTLTLNAVASQRNVFVQSAAQGN